MIRRFYTLFPDKNVILQLTVFHIALALLQGLLLAFLVPILEVVLRPQPDFPSIEPWLTAGFICFLLYLVLTVMATPIGFGASMKMAAQLRKNAMARIAQFPLGWFTGDKKTRLARNLTTDIGLIAQLAVTVGAPTIVALLVPTVIIIVTFFINWITGLILLIIMPLSLFVLRWAARISAEEDIKLDKAATKIAGKAIEIGQAQSVLRAAGKGIQGTMSLNETLKEHRIVYRKGLERATLPFLSFIAAITIGFVIVTVLVAHLFLDQSLSVSVAIVLFILAVRFFEPLAHLTELIGALKAMDNAIMRVQDLMRTSTLKMPEHPVREIKNTNIQFKNVSFGYGEKPVIKNVSFSCPQGSTTGLIGVSGSGKTTLIRLIARFYDIDQGMITIGETDIKQLDYYHTLMKDIAIIFQNVYLFDTSIKENLLIAKPDATETELREAATAAQLNEMLERLPDGWDTKVGEGGMQLSGGERQRVSIARAFLKNARIVLIDEASSALDPENEKAISLAISNLTNNPERTVIVIAHRSNILKYVNQIIVLDKGQVAEFGSPEELLKKNGMFAHLYKQFEESRNWDINIKS
ncbi:ABC transporter ATP-binding protein [Arenibacter sp. M-2]|uniref:ABC transporter ATP-binding protein n=1 Tax=Arenibacter sp. M-2 TaxID=3053612 RepID=UPI0025707408|nr:ABC transporter ATP-binding protein [Arenibacter sp. M-2]MDL5511100.1 ABC transporter ATP-binding protein [Arenibacter sp. M-2]